MSDEADKPAAEDPPFQRPANSHLYDCQACGACCRSGNQNRRDGFTSYIQVLDFDALRAHPDLMAKWTVPDAKGEPHMKLQADGRCTALSGKIGVHATCDIYALRPHCCQRVQAGSQECLRARREHGISEAAP